MVSGMGHGMGPMMMFAEAEDRSGYFSAGLMGYRSHALLECIGSEPALEAGLLSGRSAGLLEASTVPEPISLAWVCFAALGLKRPTRRNARK